MTDYERIVEELLRDGYEFYAEDANGIQTIYVDNVCAYFKNGKMTNFVCLS